MEPRKEELKQTTSQPRPEEKKRRFRLVKVEERRFRVDRLEDRVAPLTFSDISTATRQNCRIRPTLFWCM